VSLRIFDITGELVYEESIPAGDPRAQAGPQETPWDGRNMNGDVVRNGIYVCALNAGSKSAKIRIAVAK
jgi:flagellar hook assembly protein FlgD